MADDFNADDYLNDGGTAQAVETKVQKKSTITETNKELSQKLGNHELTDEQRTRIIDASYATVADIGEETKVSLREMVKDLTAFENDELKSVLAEFATLNEEEQAIVDAPMLQEKILNSKLAALEATSDNIWNRWVKGRSKKIQAIKEKLELIPAQKETAANKAESMREARFQEAKVQELLSEIDIRAKQIVKVYQEKKQDAQAGLNLSRQFLDNAQKVFMKASKKLKTVGEELETNRALLRQEEQKLLSLTQATPEHATQSQVISDFTLKISTLKADLKTAQTIYDSKENFIKKHQITIETLETQISNMTAIQAKLSSDTKERGPFYESYVNSVILASAEEYASYIEEFGEQTDIMLVDHFLSMKYASDNNFVAMLKKHKGRQDRYHESLKVLVQGSAKFDIELDKLDAMRQSGYGLDQSELFSGTTLEKPIIRKSTPSSTPNSSPVDDGGFDENEFLAD